MWKGREKWRERTEGKDRGKGDETRGGLLA